MLTTTVKYHGLRLLLGTVLMAISPAFAVRVIDGPIVLYSNATFEWGGHTFSYALQGERYLFWTATLNKWEKGPQDEAYPSFVRHNYKTQLVGQTPVRGTDGVPAVHVVSVGGKNIVGGPQPLLFRTPDGYLHMIVGAYRYDPDKPTWFTAGELRYYRSARPEDVTKWVDRTELIPSGPPYNQFHLRMNVAVTLDGKRAVITVLAASEDGSVPFNTPVIFYGRRERLDFRFDKPVKYHDPLAFFYPLAAASDGGVVLVGNVWDVSKHATSRLIHLDWNGNILHEQALPADAAEGSYLSYDMRPAQPGDWEHLVIYHRMGPNDGPWRHDFLAYDVAARRLTLANEVPTEEGFSNSGKWLYISPKRSVFINNPSMGRIQVWEGDILGDVQVAPVPLPGMDPLELGYQASSYVMIPNPCQGSITVPGEAYVMSDVHNPGKPEYSSATAGRNRGPCSLLLWRLALND